MSIVHIKELKATFIKELKDVESERSFIEDEIEAIESYVKYLDRPVKRQRGEWFVIPDPKLKHAFKIDIAPLNRRLFGESFMEFKQTGRKCDLSKLDYDEEKRTVKQAYEFVEYYKWLKKKLEGGRSTGVRKRALSHKQTILALKYLGVFDMNRYEDEVSNEAFSKIISKIIDFSEDNTRQFMSYLGVGLNDVYTERNLKKVLSEFENCGLKSLALEVKNDIDKLKKKKL